MILHSLELQNFRQHANSVLHFPPSGVIGLVGSNEAGKSTILEAIAWALYGQKAARGAKDSIRWNRATARKLAQVRLEFECGGSRYHVTRTETDSTVVDVGSGRKVASGTAAVNEYLPRLIGMELDEFRATYLCAQKDIDRIATMKPVERGAFFRSVLGVSKIDDAIEKVRTRRNSLKNEVAGLSAGLGERGPLLADLNSARDEISALGADLEHAQAEATKAKQAATACGERLEASEKLRAQDDAAMREWTRAVNAMGAAESELGQAVDRLKRAREAAERVKVAERYLAPLPVLLAEEKELARAQLLAGQHADLLRQRDQAERDASVAAGQIADAERQIAFYIGDFKLAGLERNLTEARKELDGLRVTRTERSADARGRIASAEAELRKAHRRIEAILGAGEDGACPTCTRRLGEHYQQVIAELREEAHGIQSRINAATGDLLGAAEPGVHERQIEKSVEHFDQQVQEQRKAKAHAQAAAKVLERETAIRKARLVDYDTFDKKLAELGTVVFDDEQLAYVQGEIERLREQERAVEPVRMLAARIPELEAEHAQRAKAFADAEATAEQLLQTVRAIGFDHEAHVALERETSEAVTAATQAGFRVLQVEAQVNAATDWEARSARNLATYDERAGRLTALTAELRTHERTAERLVEFRNVIANTIRPEMEELVSGFVSILTDGRHEAATIDENFDVQLFEGGVPVPVVSGGTEDIIAFALRLAVSQMIAERAGHPLSLLVLDEVFTSLDEVRRSGALALIRRLQSVFSQVILISHIPEIRESVDTVFEIVYDEAAGCSCVIGSTSPAAAQEVVAA